MNRAMRCVGFLALVLALCCAAAPRSPHLMLAPPWQSLTPPPAQGDVTPIEEWGLSNGLPGPQPTDVTQYVQLSTMPGGEGGLGGFVADRITWRNGAHDITKLTYAKIDECLRPAWLFTLDEPDQGVRRSYEEVVFAVGQVIYEARYSRPAVQGENAAAHAAILDLCNYRTPKP